MKITENENVLKDEISLREVVLKLKAWIRFLNERRKIIILVTLIGAALGLLASLLSQAEYKGQLTFVLENDGKSKNGVTSIAAQFGLSLGGASGGVFQGDENMMALVQSKLMVTRALLSEDPYAPGSLLVDRFIALNDLKDSWSDNAKLKGLNFHADAENHSRVEDSLLTVFHDWILKRNLQVDQPNKKNDIIEITAVSPDPYFSKAFPEKLLENVTRFYIESQTKRSKENVDILRHQVDSIRTLLNNALSGAAVYGDENPNLNPAFQRLKVASQKKLVDVEMNKAILEELVKQLGLAEITLRKETPLVQVIDTPTIPIKPQKLGKAKGILIGAVLSGLFIVIYLTLARLFKAIMSDKAIK